MAVTMQDPRATPRTIAEQLRRFVQLADAPPTANGASLSDAGFVLISLKDHILAEGPRVQSFCQEFVSRPINGIDLLSKVVIILQAIVNSHAGNSKLTSFLSRSSNNANRKRKAAVAEADCIECMKILLEKTEGAWRFFLESATGLDAVLNSVHSPQLDSKCYALEILLLLLDQPQGFVVFFRAVTAQAGRNRDYLRLSTFIAQMKHGLHTNKLHIQILVVRLFNKLLSTAPSTVHHNLAKDEMALVHFNTDYVEKGGLGGMDILTEEMTVWRSLYNSGSYVTPMDSHLYGISENESDTTQSDRGRRTRPPVNKYPIGNTTVVKNVERQRFKKQGMGSGGRASAPTYYPLDSSGRQSSTGGFYPDRRALTLSSRWNGEPDTIRENQWEGYATTDRRRLDTEGGGMRRAKSESAMIINDREEMLDSLPRGLKRYHKEQPLYHPIQHSKPISRSVHDLSNRVDSPSATLARGNLMRPSSVAAAHPTSPRPVSPGKDSLLAEPRPSSPYRVRYASPISPRARFAEPAVVEAQQPHGGFSYLFPSQPVVASVVPKRAITPEPGTRQTPSGHPPSVPLYATAHSPISRGVSPRHDRFEASSPVYTENGQVVYIPINMSDGTRITKASRRDARDDYIPESRSSSRMKLQSPSDDVRDALSRFDYLNEYDNNSLRKDREVSYHF